MADSSKLPLIQEMLDSAEASIKTAKKLLTDMSGGKLEKSSTKKYSKQASEIESSENEEIEEGENIVEGVFDGQNMIGADKKTYPVPANYASKSKLVPGDILKLTIKEDGSFIYKQIHPVERKRVIGTLTYEDGQYQVLTEGKIYNVLLASVTYFKGDIGDKVTLIVPEDTECEWGAIENIIPADSDEAITDEQLDLATKSL